MNKQKVSWNELKENEMFLGPGGLYQKISENKAFYFNGHTEIDITKENRDSKVFERTDENADKI